MTLQRLSSDPWRVKMAHQRYLASDHRLHSPYTLQRAPHYKSKRATRYVLLVWTVVLAVSIIALYQSLQCFRGWKSSLSLMFASEEQGVTGQLTGAALEAALNPWSDYNFSYDSFSIQQPGFVYPKDTLLFGKNAENNMILRGPAPRELLGRIHVIRNGTAHRSYDCGWNMDVTVMSSAPKGRIRKRFKVMIPLLVPQSNSFQHFLDGVVPKLVQVQPLLGMRNITIMVYRPWDRVIEEMLGKFGVTPDRVQFYDNGYYAADYLVNSCVTPPLHPTLWHQARKTLGAPDTLPVPVQEAYIILLTRAKSRNIGRKIKNMEHVTNFLRDRYGDRFVVFTGGYTLTDAISLFGKARILIGVHGGAFYNMFLCPARTNIVEIIPTLANGTFVPDSVSYNIVWKMSNMLAQLYWRLSEPPMSKRGDVVLDTSRLSKALDEADTKHGL